MVHMKYIHLLHKSMYNSTVWNEDVLLQFHWVDEKTLASNPFSSLCDAQFRSNYPALHIDDIYYQHHINYSSIYEQ